MSTVSTFTLFPVRPVLRIINALFLSYILQIYSINIGVSLPIPSTYLTYVINVVYIYAIQWVVGLATKQPRLSSLRFALENRMDEFPEEVERSKINRDITNVLLTVVLYFVMLAVLSWVFILTLQLLPPDRYFQLLNFDLEKIKLLVPILSLYMCFIYCGDISYHDYKHNIIRSDNVMYQVGAVTSLVLLVLIIVFSGY